LQNITKLETTLLEEFDHIMTKVDSMSEQGRSVKTEHYLIYSVTDPHKTETIQAYIDSLKNFTHKDKLQLKNANHVLELKLKLNYIEYHIKRSDFLRGFGCSHNFKVNKPRRRDRIFSLARKRHIKEIAQNGKFSIAYYQGTTNENYIEILFKGNLKTRLYQIRNALRELTT